MLSSDLCRLCTKMCTVLRDMPGRSFKLIELLPNVQELAYILSAKAVAWPGGRSSLSFNVS